MQTLAMINQAFKEESMSHIWVEWHAQFRATSTEDNHRKGRPISSTTLNTTAKFQKLICEDQAIQNLADENGIGYWICQ
jgi:hypothetical protein